GGESGRVSRAERRGEHRGHEARRACADASEKPDRPWHRTTSSSRIITLRSSRVKAYLSLGEFAHDATAGIFNDYVALQVWAGTPAEFLPRSTPFVVKGFVTFGGFEHVEGFALVFPCSAGLRGVRRCRRAARNAPDCHHRRE